jgi:hypothetical protein
MAKKSAPSWSDVKAKLADFDHSGLVGLVQDRYAASKDNQSLFACPLRAWRRLA